MYIYIYIYIYIHTYILYVCIYKHWFLLVAILEAEGVSYAAHPRALRNPELVSGECRNKSARIANGGVFTQP